MSRVFCFVGLITVACGGQEDTCAPGATQECTCPNGTNGAQVCADDGSRWNACDCAQAERVCDPGATRSCSCADGASGAQPCAGDGRGWGVCECVPAAAVATSTDTDRTGAGMAGMDPRRAPTANDDALGPQPYRIHFVSAEIAPTKPNGADWDVGGGAPDVRATVAVRGAGNGRAQSTMIRDSTAPQWNQTSGVLQINRGDTLSVTLVDIDAMAHDTIATWSHTFDRPGRVELTAPDHSVESFVFEVRPDAE